MKGWSPRRRRPPALPPCCPPSYSSPAASLKQGASSHGPQGNARAPEPSCQVPPTPGCLTHSYSLFIRPLAPCPAQASAPREPALTPSLHPSLLLCASFSSPDRSFCPHISFPHGPDEKGSPQGRDQGPGVSTALPSGTAQASGSSPGSGPRAAERGRTLPGRSGAQDGAKSKTSSNTKETLSFSKCQVCVLLQGLHIR